MRIIGKIFLIATLAILFFPVAASADFTLSPLKQIVSLAPGSAGAATIKISNQSGGRQAFSLKVLGMKQDGAGRPIWGNGFSSAEQWVKPARGSLTLAAGEEQSADFFINLPADATAGSYYLGLAASALASPESNGVGLSGQLVSILSLQVAGQAVETAIIDQWQTEKIFLKSEWPFDLSVRNSGNMELPLAAEAMILDWRGRPVYKEPVNLGPALLPGAGRSFAATLRPVGGFYWPGPYSAEIRLTYGRLNQIASAEVKFWYFPWWSLAVAAVLLALVIFWRKKKKVI